MKIDSLDKTVGEMLKSGFYCIPRFQRPYSWDKDNILDFWNDTIVENESEYFIGSMVVYTNSKLSNHCSVVDGQQRLTTITILLAALRNALYSEGFDSKANGIHKLIETENIDYKKEFVLQTQTAYPFFQEKIQKHPPSENETEVKKEEENIEIAYRALSANIQEAIDSIKTDPTLAEKNKKSEIEKKLINIRDIVLNLKLILIELDNEDDAYLIFETLNTRGKDLSVTDLVKNHVFKKIKASNVQVDRVRDKWQSILSTIEESSAQITSNRFLLHFWLSRYDYTSEKKLFKQIKGYIKNKPNASDLVENLKSDVLLYRAIYEPDFHKWTKQEKEIKDSLMALSVFGVAQPIPAVLTILRLYFNKKIDLKNTKKVLRAIENFHFVFTAVTSQRSSGGISQMYSAYAREMESFNEDTSKMATLIRNFNSKLRDKKPKYNEFEIAFREIIYTNEYSKQKGLVQYILRKIYSHIMPAIPIDSHQSSVEHIFPQSSNLKPKICGQIGNMILISPATNSNDLRNKGFIEKMAALRKAGFQVINDPILCESTSWTDVEIQKRTQYFSELAYKKIWFA